MTAAWAPSGAADGKPAPPSGVRVVLDVRALQEPDRAPLTAAYVDGLLRACAAEPLAGESFSLLLRADLEDPTAAFDRLAVAGRRLLPPTHLLRSAALTIDPLVLSGASVGLARGATGSGATGAIHHAVGGAVPLVTGLPVVATLLDLAPWELPEAYQRTPAARFGHRLRARLLRDASAVIVGTDSVALTARRLLRLRRSRIHVVPYAARTAFRFWPSAPDGVAVRSDGVARAGPGGQPGVDLRAERARLGLPEGYIVYSGRYDARQDLGTLLRALDLLARAGRPAELRDSVVWPPRVLLVGASPGDRAALARAAAGMDVGECLAYAPRLADDRLASLVRGARCAILPSLSDAMGLPAIEAIACGTPVIASAVGALPEIVGTAGIIVEPRDPERLASALATTWLDDRLHDRLRGEARERAEADRWSWSALALATRRVYAAAAGAGSGLGGSTGRSGRGR